MRAGGELHRTVPAAGRRLLPGARRPRLCGLNILLWDSELNAAAELIRQIAQSGADALIVQDLAAAALARQICPELPLHASTQMSVHSAAGVQMLERLGFARAILGARTVGRRNRPYP